ncbi:hypothetical protein F511_27143 [Dorcoceras hygrometricum]|uniref:Splicing factor 3B subunit 1-like n=1 Tax=Dorcoceras hygrometricum TaxID=472368 RepID=A0A2Z7BB59_9LAMI|nr:hypothetical protein F511_27143 [Dorcoceras hygrometricum]
MKIEFILLSDILAKSIFVKAGSFDAVTHERFLMMVAINGGVNINWSRDLELGDFKAFPPLKILTEKTVNRYIAINDKISVEDLEGVEDESRVKKTPMKNAVSKKRPATAVDEHLSKNKRTGVEKAAKSLAIVTVAQEAIPLQIVEPIRAMPDVIPSKPKRKAPKRRLKLPAESDDEIVKEETAVGGIAEKDSMPARADVVDKEISTADDVDHIIEQIVAETAQFEADVGGTNVGEINVEDQAVQRADEIEHWLNISYDEFVAREADRMVESGSDTDEEIVAAKATGTDSVMGAADLVDNEEFSLAKNVATMTESEDTGSLSTALELNVSTTYDEESMSLEDILKKNPADVMLPSVTATEITRIKFAPSIAILGVHEVTSDLSISEVVTELSVNIRLEVVKSV